MVAPSRSDVPSLDAFLLPAPERIELSVPEAARRWLAHEVERVARDEVRASSLEAYKTHVRRHLVPQFGTFYVHDVETRHLKAWISALKSCRSDSTVRTNASHSRTFFLFCQEQGAIVHSPWRDLPRGLLPPKGPRDKTKRPREVLSLADMARVIFLTPDFDDRALYTAALLGMLRPGELFEARWKDYDPQARKLNVARSWRSKGRRVGPTKSGEPRDVPVHSLLKAILDTTFARRTLEHGEAPGREELIFLRDGRHRWMQGAALDRWRKNLDELGIPPVFEKQRDLYSARHTGVTQLRIANAPKHVVQAFTHTCNGPDRFDRQSAFGHYDHSGRDWASCLKAIDLLVITRAMVDDDAVDVPL